MDKQSEIANLITDSLLSTYNSGCRSLRTGWFFHSTQYYNVWMPLHDCRLGHHKLPQSVFCAIQFTAQERGSYIVPCRKPVKSDKTTPEKCFASLQKYIPTTVDRSVADHLTLKVVKSLPKCHFPLSRLKDIPVFA